MDYEKAEGKVHERMKIVLKQVEGWYEKRKTFNVNFTPRVQNL